MQRVGESMRAARVAAIYLVHGTFIGPDALGLLADLSRISPSVADALRRWNKQLIDGLAGEVGNFTRGYAERFERLLSADGEPPIPVRLWHWSSENHHLGRADGAVRLLDHLVAQRFPTGSRVLLWGHSHSGNVFALATNLIGSDLAARRQFFACCRSFYHCPLRGMDDLPEWTRMREYLCEQEDVLPNLSLDIATLGTPIRYGWDTNGYGQLLHFVNHRPVAGQPPYRAPFPPTTDDVLSAAHGDLVHQIGIAGTNIPPPFWAGRAWWADVRLRRLLQRHCHATHLLRHLALGMRAHDEGENLLVDYGPEPGNLTHHLFGHAVYTRREWMLFHAEEIARRFYGLELPPGDTDVRG